MAGNQEFFTAYLQVLLLDNMSYICKWVSHAAFETQQLKRFVTSKAILLLLSLRNELLYIYVHAVEYLVTTTSPDLEKRNNYKWINEMRFWQHEAVVWFLRRLCR